MGQTTYFEKNKDKYLEKEILFDTLDLHEDGTSTLMLNDDTIAKIRIDIEYIECLNTCEDFCNTFRSRKKDIEEVFFTRESCLEWINDPQNLVYFRNPFCYAEEESEYRLRGIQKLNDFWDSYPNGVIYFI
jgi:hypothetical protein